MGSGLQQEQGRDAIEGASLDNEATISHRHLLSTTESTNWIREVPGLGYETGIGLELRARFGSQQDLDTTKALIHKYMHM